MKGMAANAQRTRRLRVLAHGIALGALFAVLVPATGHTQAPAYRVKDINSTPIPVSSFPSDFLAVGPTVFFVANGAGGIALWKTDGSEAGTVRLSPGFARLDYMTDVGGALFFVTDDGGGGGTALWMSDATPAGTALVKQIPGIAREPRPDESLLRLPFVAVDKMLFFAIGDASIGYELWKSDGTPSGTALLAQLGIDRDPPQMRALDGALIFDGFDAASGYELWRSDGTQKGTVRIKDINPGPEASFLSLMGNVGGALLFSAQDGENRGTNLWRTDGTPAGTLLVSRIIPSVGWNGYFATVNDTMFLSAYGGSRAGLWKTDGTAAGTVRVLDVLPELLTDVDGTLFFFAGGAHELWKSDGTAAGTQPIRGIGSVGVPFPGVFEAANGRLFFQPADGGELWASDGTADGTGPLGVFPGFSDPHVTAVGPTTFLYDGTGLYATDGTAAGTVFVTGVAVDGTRRVPFANSNGAVVFAGEDRGEVELWKSDGTAAGTVRIADVAPEFEAWTPSSRPASLTNLNGTLFFIADDGISGTELWRSDGSAADTVLVKDINPGPRSSLAAPVPNYAPLTAVGDTLFFVADDGVTGTELWKSDGTADGTMQVVDLHPGPDGSRISGLANLNGRLFFVNGTELWESDGTAAGAARVADLGQENGSFEFASAAAFGTTLFVATGALSDGRHVDIWKSDGTAAGTVRLKTIDGVAAAGDFVVANDVALFVTYIFNTYYNAVMPYGVWRTDGTSDGTAPLARPSMTAVASANGRLFYADYYQDLYSSEDLAGSPSIIGRFNDISALSAVGDQLLFQACPYAYFYARERGGTTAGESPHPTDCEVWESDGTSDGTRLLADIGPERASSYPGPFTVAGAYVFFPATDGSGDTELWALPITSVGACGNGVQDPGEACDTAGQSATCEVDCLPSRCGDFRLNAAAGEQCDDGNALDDDCCTRTCAVRSGQPCGHLNVCEGIRTCSDLGVCMPGTPLDCDDGDSDTLDSCDAVDGCVHTAISPCVGDCSDDGMVTIDELLSMVAASLEGANASCAAGDADRDGHITVDEIITAVSHALTGCDR